MPSRHNPADSIAAIIENAARIQSYLAVPHRAAFERNDLVRDAVERCLERICEAAHRLGETAAILMPDRPWADIRGMGNRLRHAYDRINLDIIWNTVTARVPSLGADARAALRHLEHHQPDGKPPGS